MRKEKNIMHSNIGLPKICFCMDDSQLLMTGDDSDYRLGHVVLVKLKLFSRKLTPFDMKTGKTVNKMKYYVRAKDKYYEVDIEHFIQKNIFSRTYNIRFTDPEYFKDFEL